MQPGCPRIWIRRIYRAEARPSPLATGELNTWACRVVYSAGRLNVLFDQSQPRP
ncbi:DUF6398 domain-containing protein [Thiocapsa bogorovii]|uniref:DUF6398 domain-containing protein n=1 Tax=Thiocapsa bogorovii TaxID=521689 RepID=UPI0038CD21C4